MALGRGDESAVARAFLDATRPFKVVAVRGAVVNGRRLAADDVSRLAALPSREVLLAQLAGAIASPLSSMAGLLGRAAAQPRRRAQRSSPTSAAHRPPDTRPTRPSPTADPSHRR